MGAVSDHSKLPVRRTRFIQSSFTVKGPQFSQKWVFSCCFLNYVCFYVCTDRLWLKNRTGANACKLAVARIPVYVALVAFYINPSLLICMVPGI